MIFCSISNSLHACDSLRIRQTCRMFFQIYCMCIDQIVCSSNSLFVKFMTEWLAIFLWMFLFSIFDKIEFIRVHCSRCVSCEIVFSLRDIRTNTSKVLFWLEIIESIDFLNSKCSKRFMMKRFCIEKCQDRYIHFDLVAFKVISRNRLIQINF